MINILRKPEWLQKKIDFDINRNMKKILRDVNVCTVCENALCPNISECFKDKTATFMILGDTCVRDCKFCNVKKGLPGIPDKDEPKKISEAVKRLKLDYVVITTVTRDDLYDAGAGHFADVVKEIRKNISNIKIEILTSDLYVSNETQSLKSRIETILDSGIDVYGHNIEMPESLYGFIRSKADYNRSLKVLETVKEVNKKIFTKSSLLLGFGETKEDIIKTMQDLKKVNCDFILIGQYLPPSRNHIKLEKYITNEEFDEYKNIARDMGFIGIESGPYVRSSYKAKELFLKAELTITC